MLVGGVSRCHAEHRGKEETQELSKKREQFNYKEAELKKEIEKLKEAVDSARSSTADLQAQIKEKDREYAHLERLKDEVVEQLAAAKVQKQTVEASERNLQDSETEKENRLNMVVKEIAQLQQQLATDKKNSEREVLRLQKQVSSVEKKLADSSRAYEAEIERHKASCNVLKQQTEKEQARIADVKLQLAKEVAALHSQRDVYETQLEETQRDKETLQEVLEELKASHLDLEQKVAIASEMHTKRVKELEWALQKKQVEIERVMKTHQNALEESEANVKKMKKAMKLDQEETKEQLTKKQAWFDRKETELKREIKKLQEAVDSARSTTADLQAEIEEKIHECAQLESLKEKVADQLAAAEVQKQTAEAAERILKDRLEAMAVTHRENVQLVEMNRCTLREKQREFDDLQEMHQKALDKLESEKQELVSRFEESQSLHDCAKAESKQVTENLLCKIRDFEDVMAAKDTKIQELEQHLNEVEDEIGKLQRTESKLRANLNNVKFLRQRDLEQFNQNEVVNKNERKELLIQCDRLEDTYQKVTSGLERALSLMKGNCADRDEELAMMDEKLSEQMVRAEKLEIELENAQSRLLETEGANRVRKDNILLLISSLQDMRDYTIDFPAACAPPPVAPARLLRFDEQSEASLCFELGELTFEEEERQLACSDALPVVILNTQFQTPEPKDQGQQPSEQRNALWAAEG